MTPAARIQTIFSKMVKGVKVRESETFGIATLDNQNQSNSPSKAEASCYASGDQGDL